MEELIRAIITGDMSGVEGFVSGYSDYSLLCDEVENLILREDQIRKVISVLRSNRTRSKSYYLLISCLFSKLKDFDSAKTYAYKSFSLASDKISFSAYANSSIEVFNDFVRRNNLAGAEKELFCLKDFVKENRTYDPHVIFANAVETLRFQLNGYVSFDEKIKYVERKLNQERRKTIEIIGLFSSVLAFVLSSVNILSKIEAAEATSLLMRMGIFLLLFPLMICLLFRDSTEKTKGDWFVFSVLILGIVVAVIFG